jgi:hypothetical protein
MPAGVAFVHDLLRGPLPDEYAACDVFYADLPWPAGFAEFERRAGLAPGRSYGEFMAAVSRIINTVRRPILLTAGKLALRHLPKSPAIVSSKLNGAACVVIMFHADIQPACSETVALLGWLAERYGCIGDFCCGYGRAGRIFAERGKRFVMSDYNPECIGYIGETIGGNPNN